MAFICWLFTTTLAVAHGEKVDHVTMRVAVDPAGNVNLQKKGVMRHGEQDLGDTYISSAEPSGELGHGVGNTRHKFVSRQAESAEPRLGHLSLESLIEVDEDASSQTNDSTAATTRMNAGTLASAKDQLNTLMNHSCMIAPTLLRLAWHSSGTYDRMTKTGGSGKGTIRFKEELAHGANAGLDKAVSWLEPIKKSFPEMSYADLYTLAGVQAIAHLKGPRIPWRAGRVDSMEPSDVTPDGRLPNADMKGKEATHLREIFGRMGFDDQSIVALSGAHSVGRAYSNRSGFSGFWTSTHMTFSNRYFKLLKEIEWEEGCVKGETCKAGTQYRNSQQWGTSEPQTLMMLPTDLALVKDTSFGKWVDIYAQDEEAFFQDFAKAFQTLVELGTSNLYNISDSE